MKNIINEIGVIAVKDKQDVLKADELLKKIGITVFKSKEIKDKFIQHDIVENEFLIGEDDGWRIQSHFIGDGRSIEKLDEKISQLLLENPNLKENIETFIQLKNNIEQIKKAVTHLETHLIDTQWVRKNIIKT